MRNVMTDPYATPEPSEQSASPSADSADLADEPTAPVVFGASVFAGPAPQAPTTPTTPTTPGTPDSPYAPAFPSSYPASYPAAYPPAFGSPAPPKRKRRTGLIVGIVLTVAALLCAGGGTAAYFLIQNAQPVGQATPDKATRGFLTAIYTDHDVKAATGFVCPDARDSAKLTKVINDLTAFEQEYEGPTVTWDTPTITTEKVTGTAHISLTLKTDDERVASKKLVLDLLNSRGWWVCDVRPES
jgi:hypothetical protein